MEDLTVHSISVIPLIFASVIILSPERSLYPLEVFSTIGFLRDFIALGLIFWFFKLGGLPTWETISLIDIFTFPSIE